ncbi:Golgi apparatus membrane protein TVP23 [Frankliniella fusca]|uniref:Golgi apparatus membrane protein TVP23 n=1 Tax=Frankliniella fusca TaxID=407009 RepID=A0AAE1HUY2_9NEOP|nr:Golgi apparatus membrane protein TVP23 [Frankliniella fusca]
MVVDANLPRILKKAINTYLPGAVRVLLVLLSRVLLALVLQVLILLLLVLQVQVPLVLALQALILVLLVRLLLLLHGQKSYWSWVLLLLVLQVRVLLLLQVLVLLLLALEVATAEQTVLDPAGQNNDDDDDAGPGRAGPEARPSSPDGRTEHCDLTGRCPMLAMAVLHECDGDRGQWRVAERDDWPRSWRPSVLRPAWPCCMPPSPDPDPDPDPSGGAESATHHRGCHITRSRLLLLLFPRLLSDEPHECDKDRGTKPVCGIALLLSSDLALQRAGLPGRFAPRSRLHPDRSEGCVVCREQTAPPTPTPSLPGLGGLCAPLATCSTTISRTMRELTLTNALLLPLAPFDLSLLMSERGWDVWLPPHEEVRVGLSMRLVWVEKGIVSKTE